MKIKFLVQWLLTILIIVLLIPFSNASSSTLSASGGTNVGDTITVTLNVPSNAYAAEATVTITYSDGSTSSQKIAYINGLSSNSVSFSAKTAGNATISASNIILSDQAGNELENGGQASTSVNISDGGTSQAQTSSQTTTSSSSSSSSTDTSFSNVNETVYTTDTCNVRSSASTSSSIVTKLQAGTKLTRTGTSSSGWSKVSLNGQTVYISSKFLTTSSPVAENVTFTDCNDTMYAISNCNLRTSWSTSSSIAGGLTAGQEVTRTGYSSTGWSRLNLNGTTVYVATRLLTSDSVSNNIVENEITNETNEVAEGEKTELELLQENIGVLPEVGKNVAVKIYGLVAFLAFSFSIVMYLYLERQAKTKI